MNGLRPLALAAGVAAALAGPAQAQTGTASPTGPTASSAEPYRDRIIASDQLQPLPPDEDEDTASDLDGPPRSLRVDLGLSRNERGDEAFDEQGVSASGFWESAALGSFSLDAGLFRSDRMRERAFGGRGWGGTATLWQRNLHLDGGWRVDNGLGVLNSPSLPLQREQYRFFLPSVPLAGLVTHWRDDARDLQVQAAYGRAGAYTGTRATGFEAADGQVASLGTQWQWTPAWTGAASYLATYGRLVPDLRGEAVLEPGDTRALHLSTGWRADDASLQFNLLGSDGDRGGARGAWMDGRLRRGRYLHQYGAYRLEPELAWGAYPIQNDAEGGYYRLAYDYGRWHWSGGVDALRPLSGRDDATQYATGYLRYQATSTLGYGGGLNVRRSDGLSHSAQVFADRRSRWGQTRLQLDQARAASDDSWQVGVDHAFALQQGARLSASLALGRLAYRDNRDGSADEAASAGSTRTATFALYGGRDLTGRLTLDGSARWTHGDGDEAVRGLDLNLGLDWRIARRWSLAFAAYQSQGSRRSPFILDPLVTRTPYLALPRERSLLLTLRYHYEAGRPQTVIGGAPGAAAGGVRGSVFLDENRNGLREASELPAANVTVLLDGRYSVRTDGDGRFGFPRVAVGTHTLTVEPDNLPLPWSFEGENAQRTVEVEVRGDARVDLGAQRPR